MLKVEVKMDNKFQKTYTVRSVEMDSNYRLKKIEISRYFQETFALFCKENEFAAFDLVNDNLIWVLSQMHIEFNEEMPKWSEDVSTTIWISEIGKLKIYVDFEITYKGKCVARGDSLWFILNSITKRPINPAPILKNVKVCNELAFGEHSKFDLVEDGEFICDKTFNVRIFDLDFNKHMNNICYASFAMHTVPVEILTSANVKSYKIKFLKECFLDDEIDCKMYQNGEKMYFLLTRLNDNTDVCKLEIKLT